MFVGFPAPDSCEYQMITFKDEDDYNDKQTDISNASLLKAMTLILDSRSGCSDRLGVVFGLKGTRSNKLDLARELPQLAAPLKGLMPAPCRLLPPLIPHLSILIQW